MNKLLAVLFLVISSGVYSGEAEELRFKGQKAAHIGDASSAQRYFGQSAKLGDPTAQIEYALSLEFMGKGIQNIPESYAWYSVVIYRQLIDTTFAEERVLVLEKSMSAVELLRATELSVEYKAKYVETKI